MVAQTHRASFLPAGEEEPQMHWAMTCPKRCRIHLHSPCHCDLSRTGRISVPDQCMTGRVGTCRVCPPVPHDSTVHHGSNPRPETAPLAFCLILLMQLPCAAVYLSPHHRNDIAL